MNVIIPDYYIIYLYKLMDFRTTKIKQNFYTVKLDGEFYHLSGFFPPEIINSHTTLEMNIYSQSVHIPLKFNLL